MTPSDWKAIAEKISSIMMNTMAASYHGTDTMPFTASAVSFIM
ncbi:MAG: asparaginase domain-containing protein [Candidatus Malihini olakiniferum]